MLEQQKEQKDTHLSISLDRSCNELPRRWYNRRQIATLVLGPMATYQTQEKRFQDSYERFLLDNPLGRRLDQMQKCKSSVLISAWLKPRTCLEAGLEPR